MNALVGMAGRPVAMMVLLAALSLDTASRLW